MIMRPSLSKKEEKTLYWICVSVLFMAVLLMLITGMLGIRLADLMPGCLFLQLTGYYCPGCGGTRAVMSLFQGDFLHSLLYHPVVLYTAIVVGWYVLSHTIELVSKEKYAIGMRYRDCYLYLAVAVVLVNWIIKNLFILLLGVYLLQ